MSYVGAAGNSSGINKVRDSACGRQRTFVAALDQPPFVPLGVAARNASDTNRWSQERGTTVTQQAFAVVSLC